MREQNENNENNEYSENNEWISQRWERTTDGRYYEARLSTDLFGDWVVTKNWGGINKATGRVCINPYLPMK